MTGMPPLRIWDYIVKRLSFPKTKRLVTNKQFKAVIARNRRASNGLLTLFVAENNLGYPRLGVSVAKSCGGAVVRSRLKRLLREAFRQTQHLIPPGFDYLLMVSPQWSKKPDKAAGARDTGLSTAGSANRRRLSFEMVKGSFLALVDNLVARKRSGPNQS